MYTIKVLRGGFVKLGETLPESITITHIDRGNVFAESYLMVGDNGAYAYLNPNEIEQFCNDLTTMGYSVVKYRAIPFVLVLVLYD